MDVNLTYSCAHLQRHSRGRNVGQGGSDAHGKEMNASPPTDIGLVLSTAVLVGVLGTALAAFFSQ
jgi:hypothetical protein